MLLIDDFNLLDDGSSSCCCWADGDRAEMLLRIQETAAQTSISSHGTLRLGGNKQRLETMGCFLKKMLIKHRRIIVRNYGVKCDPSFPDTTCTVDSDKILSTLEEDVLRLITLNAQDGPNMVSFYFLLR